MIVYHSLRISLVPRYLLKRLISTGNDSYQNIATFALMTTGAFSRNVGKLFSELKLVTDNLLLYL